MLKATFKQVACQAIASRNKTFSCGQLVEQARNTDLFLGHACPDLRTWQQSD